MTTMMWWVLLQWTHPPTLEKKVEMTNSTVSLYLPKKEDKEMWEIALVGNIVKSSVSDPWALKNEFESELESRSGTGIETGSTATQQRELKKDQLWKEQQHKLLTGCGDNTSLTDGILIIPFKEVGAQAPPNPILKCHLQVACHCKMKIKRPPQEPPRKHKKGCQGLEQRIGK